MLYVGHFLSAVWTMSRTYRNFLAGLMFLKAVFGFDCNYNRSTTEDKAFFFKNSEEQVRLMETMEVAKAERVGRDMAEIAQRRYTWRIVAQQYFALLQYH